MVMPMNIRVGQIDANVKITTLDTDDNYGVTNKETGEIRINKNTKGDMLKITLLHELVHVMEANNSSIKELSEVQVDHIAANLYSLIRDNPRLMEYIRK